MQGLPMSAERSALHASALRLWQQRQQAAWIPMQGYSMLPILRPGDQLQVTPPAPTYRRGQIVVLCQRETLVVHRVIARRCTAGVSWWITQGDNSAEVDAAVVAEEIEGRVIAFCRAGQHYRIDQPSWQIVGWLVAICSGVAWARRCRRLGLQLLVRQLRRGE